MFTFAIARLCRNVSSKVSLKNYLTPVRFRNFSHQYSSKPKPRLSKENIGITRIAFFGVGGCIVLGSYVSKNGTSWTVQCDSNVSATEKEIQPLPFLNAEEKKASSLKSRETESDTTDNNQESERSTKSRVHHHCDDDEDDESYSGSKHVIQPQIKGFDWWQLGELLAPNWHWLTIAVGSALVVSAVNIEIPRLLGQVIDIVSQRLLAGTQEGADSAVIEFNRVLRDPALKIISYYCIQSAATFTYIYSLGVVGERVAAEMRKRLFSSIINQDIIFFDTHMTGEIVNVMTSDVQEFKSSFKMVVSQGLRAVSQTLGCLVSLYLVSPQMTQTVMIIVPTVIIIGSSFGSLLRKLSRKAQSQLSKATIVGEEAIGNIRTVRAFSMESQELEMYSQELENARIMNEKLAIGIGLFQAGSNLFLNSVVLGIIYSGGRLMARSEMSGGDLMAFLVAAQTIQKSLTQLSLLFGQFIRGLEAGTRVFEYINMGKVAKSEGCYIFDESSFRGDIEFKNVDFRYPTRPNQYILKNFSLSLKSGEVVALVGASGCGKSTISALIEGFYVPENGEITIDGVSLQDIDGSWLRGEMIGLINQEPILFATSVMENIRYGKPGASDKEVLKAAKNANALNFIQAFPNGFDTLVGERGVTVSGGQKQRIAIARALLKDPKILILDEATSALDTESEKIVQDTLDSVVHGRTVLIIAHRLSTIKNADKIVVINDGSIAEIGTHSELANKKGLYYNLIKQQEFTKPQKT